MTGLAKGTWASLLSVIVLGCGPSASHDAPAPSPPGFTVPMAARLKSVPSCESALSASVIVDGNQSRPISLLVDCAAGTVSGSIPGLTPGSHTFELRFVLSGVVIATAVTSGDIASGHNTPIAFAPESLIFPDDDHDGWTNLAEVIAGTDYLVASSSPESSVRRKSANYAVADMVGVAPAVGTANSTLYHDALGR